MIDVRLRMSEADLFDAGEDIGWLLGQEDGLAVSPSLRDVLLALDDALTVAITHRKPMPHARGAIAGGDVAVGLDGEGRSVKGTANAG